MPVSVFVINHITIIAYILRLIMLLGGQLIGGAMLLRGKWNLPPAYGGCIVAVSLSGKPSSGIQTTKS